MSSDPSKRFSLLYCQILFRPQETDKAVSRKEPFARLPHNVSDFARKPARPSRWTFL